MVAVDQEEKREKKKKKKKSRGGRWRVGTALHNLIAKLIVFRNRTTALKTKVSSTLKWKGEGVRQTNITRGGRYSARTFVTVVKLMVTKASELNVQRVQCLFNVRPSGDDGCKGWPHEIAGEDCYRIGHSLPRLVHRVHEPCSTAARRSVEIHPSTKTSVSGQY